MINRDRATAIGRMQTTQDDVDAARIRADRYISRSGGEPLLRPLSSASAKRAKARVERVLDLERTALDGLGKRALTDNPSVRAVRMLARMARGEE
jgi:hypothetical protein